MTGSMPVTVTLLLKEKPCSALSDEEDSIGLPSSKLAEAGGRSSKGEGASVGDMVWRGNVGCRADYVGAVDGRRKKAVEPVLTMTSSWVQNGSSGNPGWALLI